MTAHFDQMVPGAAGCGRVEVLAPFDGSVIATVDTGDRTAVETALSTAHGLFRNRDAWIPAHERIAILERTVELMRRRRDELALEAAREGGRPLRDSQVEADRAIDGMRSCIDELRLHAGRVIPMGINEASSRRIAFTRHEPIGVVVALSAFNHPLNLIVHQVGPAVAVGCPVIVKPAADTPLSCWRLVSILREAGLPPEWCQALLTADHGVTEALVSDRRVGFLSFIGSGRVGWSLRSRLAPGARCALEHGGAAPVLMAADADVDDAIPLLAKGGLYHAGQVCVSVQRIFVESRIAPDVAERLAEAARAMVVGDPTLSETDVGPLIRTDEVTRVDEWVKEAEKGGGKILAGGEVLSPSTYAPTLLLDPPRESRVSTEEIFGPVICIYPCEELDEAIDRANSLPFSFQSAIFTRNLDTALRASRRLDAAAVMVNDHTAFRVDWMPFAGLRESGHGVGGIPYTMREMQAEKLMVIRSAEL